MTLEQKPAKGTSLTEALTVDRHASSAKFLSAQPRSPAGRGTNVPLGQTVSVRLKSRPKSKTTRPITHHDPGNSSPRSAKQTPRHAAHDQSARAGKRLAAAQLSAYHGRCIRPTGEERPRPAENFIGQISIRSTKPTDRESSGPDRSDSATTRLSGRSSRTTVPTPRSTRSPF
ncbi:unnamed protein product [Microthlaspi erraticum]|uniref:Uncharacterized protein n=1 Tax=Microthlaspi erraticum TaxID=1685480 RepID=A0A6D2KL97_9BRAS|nr:unnamed protein product [Microthlaspi erraticum]